MHTIEVQGTQVSYAVNGSGRPLVLVSGTGGTLESNWAHLVEALATGRKLVRADYSGSGDTTDPPGPLTLELLAAQIIGAAHAADAAPFDLLGFSLGACVSAQIAATRPELVRSLTLVAGFPGGPDARMGLQFDLWQSLIRNDPYDFARMVMLMGFSPTFLARMDAAQVGQWLDAIVVSNRWEGILRQIELDARLDIRPLLPRISAPTLVIGCAQDQMVPREHARAVAAAIPAAHYAELDSGHLAPFEQPEALLRMLAEFLASVPS